MGTKNIIRNYIIKLVKERGGCARQSRLVMDVLDVLNVGESTVYQVLREMKRDGVLCEGMDYDYYMGRHYYYVCFDNNKCRYRFKLF